MQGERRFTQHRAATAKAGKRSDGAPMIHGYAAVFYREDDPGTEYALWGDVLERIKPGAFDAAIKDDDVRALFNHSPDYVLGRTTAGTLRLSVDATGLRYEIDPPDTQTARDLQESLKRGDISGSSFMFDIRGEEYRKEGGKVIRELTDIRLYDVGPVTFPAYTSATSGARTGGEMPAEVRRRIDAIRNAARRDADLLAITLTEMDFEMVE